MEKERRGGPKNSIFETSFLNDSIIYLFSAKYWYWFRLTTEKQAIRKPVISIWKFLQKQDLLQKQNEKVLSAEIIISTNTVMQIKSLI